jgi:hypothetical protein
MIGQRVEMLQQAALRRPHVIGACDQITVDRPVRGLIQQTLHLRGRRARQSEADRHDAADRCQLRPRHRDELLELGDAERHAFARGRRKDEAVNRTQRVVPHEPAQRPLVEFAIAEGRDQRQPQPLQPASQAGMGQGSEIGSSWIGRSKAGHRSISFGVSRRRSKKKPRPDGGVLGSVGVSGKLSARDLQPPEGRLFSRSLRTNS